MVRRFEDLPPSTVREVAKYARGGKSHPNPEVASLSQDWARRTLARPKAEVYGPRLLVDVLFSAVLGGTGGVAAGKALGERRLAKRLLSIEDGS